MKMPCQDHCPDVAKDQLHAVEGLLDDLGLVFLCRVGDDLGLVDETVDPFFDVCRTRDVGQNAPYG